MKITVEIPVVSKCVITQCALNHQNRCNAKAITIGDGLPNCDTFFISSTLSRNAERKAGVGACKVSQCRYNDDYECMAEAIQVGVSEHQFQCLTFALRMRQAKAG